MQKHNLIIDKNIEVTITKLIQYFTYGGLLEGFPNEKSNNKILERTEIEAKQLLLIDDVFTIIPEQKIIDEEVHRFFGKHQELPQVTCIVLLRSTDTYKDLKKDFSELAVIWYQNEYVFPIEDTILEKIKEIPFKKICGEFEYS